MNLLISREMAGAEDNKIITPIQGTLLAVFKMNNVDLLRLNERLNRELIDFAREELSFPLDDLRRQQGLTRPPSFYYYDLYRNDQDRDFRLKAYRRSYLESTPEDRHRYFTSRMERLNTLKERYLDSEYKRLESIVLEYVILEEEIAMLTNLNL